MPFLPDPPSWLAAIQAGRPASVYLIAGDPVLTRPVHAQLLAALLPEENRALNWEQVDGEKEEIATLIERLRTYPLFPGPKVVSVKNFWPLAPPEDPKNLLEKARATWEKGEESRTRRLLARLWSESGVPLKTLKGQDAKQRRVLCLQALEKMLSGAAPEWVTKALTAWDQGPYPEASGPEELLEKAFAEGWPAGHFLILIQEQLGRQKKMVRLLEKTGVFVDYSVKSGAKKDQEAFFKNHLKRLLAREGKTVSADTAALLFNRLGWDPGLLAMEIGKLAAYTGERNRISTEDVRLLVGVSREEPFYELTSALGEKDLSGALRVLLRLWEQGFHPLAILGGITNAFRRFLAAREWLDTPPSPPASSWTDYPSFTRHILPRLEKVPLPGSKLQPYALFNLLKAARLFSVRESIQALEALQQIDRRLKTTAAEGRSLLEDFILSRCR